MIALTLADIWQALAVKRPPLVADAQEAPIAAPAGWPERRLASVVIDSRQAEPGSLFVALPGERVDGHNYVAHAFSRGAIAALVSRPVAGAGPIVDPSQPLPAGIDLAGPACLLVDDVLVALQEIARAWRARFRPGPRVLGITGSVGKTSSKEIIATVLARRYVTLKNVGNLNNEIGLPLTLMQLNESHQRLVLEMGMYAVGEIARLCQIAQPHVGVVTNVGPVHLERLGALERIVQAKSELVEALPVDGVAILNADDPLVMTMAGRTQARVFTYGLAPDADLWADEIESQGLEGIRFRFHYQGELLHVRVPLLGRHSVHTALRAAAAGLAEGLSWEEIVSGLQDQGAQLRIVTVRGLRGATLLDDTYNASPASALAALNLLDDLDADGGRRIAVLGDMLELGSYEETGHRKVGARAADVVDHLVTVGTRARWIAEEAQAAGLAADHIEVVPDKEAALASLRLLIGPGDVVLIKGSRAMGMDQLAAALSLPSAALSLDYAAERKQRNFEPAAGELFSGPGRLPGTEEA